MIPTIEELMTCYRTIARSERTKTGRPGETTAANVLRGTRIVCREAGVALSMRADALTRPRLDTALAALTARGLSRLSAWSYVNQLRGLFARWCRPYYEDAGWELPSLTIPSFRIRSPRYQRPSPELLARVKAWYGRLKGEAWFAATMMLEFAMRNGDVLRLREENFVESRSVSRAGNAQQKALQHYLSYVPHKTELTSARRVYWPIHPAIWAKIEAAGGVRAFDVTDEIFAAINGSLRALGFHGSKAAYELRKICIDHVYQKYGAEMAVSISGDDIKTISRYYADPAQPNIGTVRIIDLL